MHRHGVGTFDKVRLPAASVKERDNLFMAHSCEERRVSDLISVQMKDGEYRTVSDRIKELIALP